MDLPAFTVSDMMPEDHTAMTGIPAIPDGEREVVKTIQDRLLAESLTDLRRLHAEASGQPEAARSMAFLPLLLDLMSKATPVDTREAHRRMAQEAAGLVAVDPARPGTPLERALRQIGGFGDRYEAELAKELGAARAREIRRADGTEYHNRLCPPAK
jgi:hypothetical protein